MARLEQELRNPELAAEAKLLLRAMIKTIIVTSGLQHGEVNLELQGELAALLAIGAKENKAPSNA